MRVRVLFFGMLKDLVGRAEERIEVEDGARLSAVFEHYARRFPRLRELSGSIVLARNQEFAAPEAVIGEGDEIAFLPPVSGGSALREAPVAAEAEDESGNYCALVRVPIDARALAARLARGCDGAVITFEGVVRNNSGGRSTRCLEYDCYVPLALKTMREIAAGLLLCHRVSRIGMVHRLGRLQIGETSVAVVVTSPHRAAAYAASREAIDRLKRLVPVWKKEYFADGEVWVDGEWDASVPRLAPSAQQSGQ
jgi:molybdopterin converting factor subunit 1